jgi:hypothetical protein
MLDSSLVHEPLDVLAKNHALLPFARGAPGSDCARAHHVSPDRAAVVTIHHAGPGKQPVVSSTISLGGISQTSNQGNWLRGSFLIYPTKWVSRTGHATP